MVLDTITREEFDRRLDAGNEKLRQELADAQERVRRLEALIARKEALANKMERFLSDLEREEAEITSAERELRPRRSARRADKLSA